MSHFMVAVISHDGDYESLLAPYSECDEEFFEPDVRAESMEDLEAQFREFCEKESNYIDEYGYKTAAEWADGWHGYRQFGDGSWGYMCNPNAKWDWYQEGGRFGSLDLKPGIQKDPGDVRVRDIDLSIDQQEYDKAIKFWESYVERGEEPDDRFGIVWKREYYPERYGTKENYARIMATPGVFAFVTPDGSWNEKGEMGWWGFNTATMDSETAFMEAFRQVMTDPQYQNCYIHFIDCHI